MKIEMEVCDVCMRPPNGDSPDCLYWKPCGHVICNECSRRLKKDADCLLCAAYSALDTYTTEPKGVS